MAKYRRKPVEIDAEQWFRLSDTSFDVIQHESNLVRDINAKFCGLCGEIYKKHGMTKRKNHLVCPGSWLIKDSEGKISVYKQKMFDQDYEKVE